MADEKTHQRTPAADVEESEFGSKKLLHIVTRMHFTLRSMKDGMRLGIAAPQCGVNKRIIIAMGELYINPTWTPAKQIQLMQEGCYSVGDGHEIWDVTRSKYGWAKWQDGEGKWHEKKLNDLPAIVFQHELTHLDGKLISDIGTLRPPSQPQDAPSG